MNNNLLFYKKEVTVSCFFINTYFMSTFKVILYLIFNKFTYQHKVIYIYKNTDNS